MWVKILYISQRNGEHNWWDRNNGDISGIYFLKYFEKIGPINNQRIQLSYKLSFLFLLRKKRISIRFLHILLLVMAGDREHEMSEFSFEQRSFCPW